MNTQMKSGMQPELKSDITSGPQVSFICVYDAASKSLGGLAWDGEGLLFADIGDSVIRRHDPKTRTVDVWRHYTNRTHGIAWGPDGELYAAQEGGRRVVRLLRDGSARPTCSELDGRYQNHPTFMASDGGGLVWMSDCYSDQPAAGPQIFPMQEQESVLRLKRDAGGAGWRLERMAAGIRSPRGIALSGDGGLLYVVDAGSTDDGSEICRYPVDAQGVTGAKSVVFRTSGRLHGVCTTADGKLLACAGGLSGSADGRILVLDAAGMQVNEWTVPGATPLHCAPGGPHGSFLYVTTIEGTLLRTVDAVL